MKIEETELWKMCKRTVVSGGLKVWASVVCIPTLFTITITDLKRNRVEV